MIKHCGGLQALALSFMVFPSLAHIVHAQTTVTLPTIDPAAITAGEMVSVTVSTLITSGGPELIAGGVNLLQVDQTGRTIKVIGTLNDTGTNGDTIAEDGIFSGTFDFEENAPRSIYLRVSAPFRGTVRRTLSQVFTLDVAPVGLPNELRPANTNNTVINPDTGSLIICNELFVSFKSNTTLDEINTAVSTVGGSLVGREPALGLYQIEVPGCELQTLNTALNTLRANPVVDTVSRDGFLQLHQTFPNDPRYPEQWYLPRIQVPNVWTTLQRG